MSPDDHLRRFTFRQLLEALKAIRQGSGWDIDDVRLRVVPEEVRSYLGIDTDGPLEEQLQHLAQLISEALTVLSTPDQFWIRWAYNLDDHIEKEWSERLEDMARDEGLDIRTIRERRVDPALGRLRDQLLTAADRRRAAPAAALGSEPPAQAELHQLLGLRANFQTRNLDVSIYVYGDHVEVRETREVEAVRDGVQDFLLSRVLFKAETTVETEVTEACHLVDEPVWQTDKWFLCVIRFPEPLAVGGRRRFVVTHTVRNMAPLFVTTAHYDTERLTVRLQCKDVRPVTVWRIERLPEAVLQATNLLQTVDRHAVPVELDRYGYCEGAFTLTGDLRGGLAWDLEGVVPRGADEDDSVA